MLRLVTMIDQQTTRLIVTHHLCSNALDLFALSNAEEVGIRPHNCSSASGCAIKTPADHRVAKETA